MSNQSWFEKIVYMVIGMVFFISYYFLMTEFFKVNPFAGGVYTFKHLFWFSNNCVSDFR